VPSTSLAAVQPAATNAVTNQGGIGERDPSPSFAGIHAVPANAASNQASVGEGLVPSSSFTTE
jgi:hypothetical protein